MARCSVLLRATILSEIWALISLMWMKYTKLVFWISGYLIVIGMRLIYWFERQWLERKNQEKYWSLYQLTTVFPFRITSKFMTMRRFGWVTGKHLNLLVRNLSNSLRVLILLKIARDWEKNLVLDKFVWEISVLHKHSSKGWLGRDLRYSRSDRCFTERRRIKTKK